ncbi:MAG: ABC transporter permease, partial [Planctomycetaceae bacterium]
LWELLVVVFKVPLYVLPRPTAIFSAALEMRQSLWSATRLTAGAAAAGFAASVVVGTIAGILFSQSKIIRSSLFPYAIFLQTVPMVAIAPLIVIWFGYGFQSVVFVSFIISLFPMITNATAGLTEIDPDRIELFRLCRATRWQILTKLRLPNAVPYLVAGAKTSAGLAVIGAIVGEFFAGYGVQQFGLGYLVRQTNDQMKTAELFAAVFACAFLGIVVFAAISVASATILGRWYDRGDAAEP